MAVNTQPQNTPAETPASFTVTSGVLSISVPSGPVPLGTVQDSVLGGSVSGQLGEVMVNDARGATAANWVATVKSSNFVNGSDVVPATGVDYAAGPVTKAGPSAGTFTGYSQTDISSAKKAADATGVTANNSLTWNPTITIKVPSGTTPTKHDGSITHSVA